MKNWRELGCQVLRRLGIRVSKVHANYQRGHKREEKQKQAAIVESVGSHYKSQPKFQKNQFHINIRLLARANDWQFARSLAHFMGSNLLAVFT